MNVDNVGEGDVRHVCFQYRLSEPWIQGLKRLILTKTEGDHVLMTHVTTQVLFICRVRYQVAGVKFSKRLAAGDWAEP